MENIEDDVVLPISEDPPSPIHKPKLKRLKKSSSTAVADSTRVFDDPIVPNRDSGASMTSESKDPDDVDPSFSVASDDPIPNSASPMYGSRDFGGGKEFEDDLDPLFSQPAVNEGFETLESLREREEEEEEEGGRFRKIGELGSEIEEEKSTRKRLNSDYPIHGSKDFGAEKEPEDDLDPLFSVTAADEGFEALDLQREREEDEGFKKSGEIGSGIEKEKSARKRLNLDEGSEEISKKRKKKKSKADDKLGKESVRAKRRSEKERMAQLEQIHAESQRLLRETRDASFKPVPVVQKPISSVLEKIRLRKLEVLKQTSILCQSDSVSASDCLMDEIVQKNSNSVRAKDDSRDNEGNVEVDDFAHVQDVGSYRNPQDPCVEIPSNNGSDLEIKDASPTLISETHETTQTVQSKYGDNNQLTDLEDSSDPPLPTSKSTPIPDDLSSEEEDDDKENIDPHTFSAVNMDSSPEGGLAKVFLDDEAEEEDDSDHDLMRFEDNEEDDESCEDEMLNDLIATGYEEAPFDHDKRNQLHQKWLEQQDAAGTDDILQRLKYGKKQRESTCLYDEDDDDNDDDDDDFGDESADEKSHDPPVTDDARQNSKKAKQMIAQMFTDADDSCVHSDDEEAEQTLLRQRILKQTSESSFISPVEDEHSREVFGLIKKLNIAPVTKKRGKTVTSSFDSLVMGANSNSASKSSFLNRTSSSSLPSLHKQASTTVRAFIFGRDDSNTRSGISTSESLSDMDLKENNPSKPAASKVNSSLQSKSTAKTKIEAHLGSASGSSLFQILRHSSMQFDEQVNNKRTNYQEITETQADYQFSAFKLGKRAAKVESRQ